MTKDDEGVTIIGIGPMKGFPYVISVTLYLADQHPSRYRS